MCSVTNCTNPVKYGGMCGMHYKRKWRHGNPYANLKVIPTIGCKVDGCDRKHEALGYCNVHYNRMYKYGRTHRVIAPKGSGTQHSGYVILTIDGRRVYEHIYVAEKALGKKLPPGACVHHMNQDRSDNYTPFNLVICPNQSYHMLLHMRMRDLGYERKTTETIKRDE